MTTFLVLGRPVSLPAVSVAEKAASRDITAWQAGTYQTVRLVARISALRVHTAGKSFPGRPSSPEVGRWLLIGDVIQTAHELADSRSLPAGNARSMTAFTDVSEVHLQSGSFLNIGIASPKFGGSGGGFQAEFLSGPPARFASLSGKSWHGRAGST